MSKEVKLIIENWRRSLNEEKNAQLVLDSLLREFVDDLKVLQEEKVELNEIFAKVGEFVKKSYNTVKNFKDDLIQKALRGAINTTLKILDKLIAQDPPDTLRKLIPKIKYILESLKSSKNMALAVTVANILLGLLTGNALQALAEVVGILDSASSIGAAVEKILSMTNAVEIGAFVAATGAVVGKVKADFKKRQQADKDYEEMTGNIKENRLMKNNDMKLIMENFNSWAINESESNLITPDDYDNFLKAFQQNVEEFTDNEGKYPQNEVVGTAFVLWGLITKGAALAGLAELIFKLSGKLVSKLREKFKPEETEKWKAEEWAENLEWFFAEVRRAFSTAGAHPFLKYFLPLLDWGFGSEKAQKKLDQFADGMSIVVAVAALAQAGVLKTFQSIFENKNIFWEILKSIGSTLWTTGQGWLKFVDGVFQVLGGGFDISQVGHAFQLFKGVFVR